MTKRPDQHNLDVDEAGSTDYKYRRNTEDETRRRNPDEPPWEDRAAMTKEPHDQNDTPETDHDGNEPDRTTPMAPPGTTGVPDSLGGPTEDSPAREPTERVESGQESSAGTGRRATDEPEHDQT